MIKFFGSRYVKDQSNMSSGVGTVKPLLMLYTSREAKLLKLPAITLGVACCLFRFSTPLARRSLCICNHCFCTRTDARYSKGHL